MPAFYENRTDPLWSTKSTLLSPQPHLHKDIEMVYVREGSVTAIADRQQHHLGPGDFFMAFPNQVHYYVSCQPGDYYLFIVSPHMLLGIDRELKEFVPESNVIHIDDSDPIATYLADAVSLDGKYRITRAHGYINLIIGNLLPRFTLNQAVQANRTTAQKIVDYCNHHFSSDLSLDAIASGLHLNKYYVSHIINRQIGLSLSDFINSLRINAACAMLRDDTKKIAEISEGVGFGSIRTFNRIFKDQINMTPREYREMFVHEKQ